MIRQKMISVKLYFNLLSKVDDEVSLGYFNRNRLINYAVDAYCDLLDVQRKANCFTDLETKKQLLRDFLQRHNCLTTFNEIL